MSEASYKIVRFSRKRRNHPERVHYFRIVAANGQTVAASQGYSRAIDRNATAEHLRDNLAGAEVRDA